MSRPQPITPTSPTTASRRAPTRPAYASPSTSIQGVPPAHYGATRHQSSPKATSESPHSSGQFSNVSRTAPRGRGTLSRDERVRRIDLRWGVYAYLLKDRTELVAELARGILRLPHIDNAKAALSLSGDVNQKSFDGPVRGGVHPLAISELSHRFLVALPRQTCSLMNEYDRHGYLLGGSERRKNTAAPRHIATLLRRYRTGSLRAWARRPSLVSVDGPRRDPTGGTRSRSAGTHDPAGQLQAGQRARGTCVHCRSSGDRRLDHSRRGRGWNRSQR